MNQYLQTISWYYNTNRQTDTQTNTDKHSVNQVYLILFWWWGWLLLSILFHQTISIFIIIDFAEVFPSIHYSKILLIQFIYTLSESISLSFGQSSNFPKQTIFVCHLNPFYFSEMSYTDIYLPIFLYILIPE